MGSGEWNEDVHYRVNPSEAGEHSVTSLRYPLDSNLHSFSRQLIELRIEHADLDATIDRLAELIEPRDDLLLRRLKKKRLALRDSIVRLECLLDPQEPA
jgi:hypothetical protein